MEDYEEILKLLHDKFDWKLTDSLTTTGKKLVADVLKAKEIITTEKDQALQLHKTQVSGSVFNPQYCKDCVHFEKPKWSSKICGECFFYDNNQQSNFKHKVK